MIKKILIILVLVCSILIPFSVLKISSDTDDSNMNKVFKKIKDSKPPILKLNPFKEKNIGNLLINKINVNEELYDINSSNNTVSKHVSIMKESTYPDQSNSLMILAAHSGEGKVAYFEELDKLKKDDEIVLIFKGEKYLYQVKDIWEEKKNGYINFNRENNKQLVLTTCSPKHEGYQLVINSILKESNLD